MLAALLLATALTSQTVSYNLLAQNERVPTAQPGPASTDEDLSASLADAQVQIRELKRELAAVQRARHRALVRQVPDQVVSINGDGNGKRSTAAPAQWVSDGDLSPYASAQAPYSSAPAASGCYSSSYSSAPAPASSGCYSSAYASAPAPASSGCYSASYSAPAYSAPMVSYQAAPVTYAAAPVFAAAPMSYGSSGSVYQERTHRGLFGGFRRRIQSANFSGAAGAFPSMGVGSFGMGFFGAGGACLSGNCQ
jgi:hypothetical protein